MPHRTLYPISPAKLRKLLAERLPTIDELDAFCLDNFPSVAKQLSDTMNRTRKENILLQCVTAEEIYAHLVDAGLQCGSADGGESPGTPGDDVWDTLKAILSCSKRTAVSIVVVLTDPASVQQLAKKDNPNSVRCRQATGAGQRSR